MRRLSFGSCLLIVFIALVTLLWLATQTLRPEHRGSSLSYRIDLVS